MSSRAQWRRMAAVMCAGALVVAACSPASGVSTDSAVPIDGSSTPGSAEPPDPTVVPSTTPTSDGLPALTEPDPGTLTGTLDNGLRYMIRDNDNPGGKAELRLAIDAGSALEDDTQLGGAHFLEHMLFNGTERFPKNELIDVLRSFGAGFGADINARTSYDETVYQLTVPNDDTIVETALDIFEEWLSFATIDPDDVEAERGIVLDEWRSRSQTSDGRVFDAFADFHLDGSVYENRSPIGGREAIESIGAEELRRFYDDWYRPDNASVIVVGDIDPGEVEAWIVERFGDATSRGDDPERIPLVVEPSPLAQVDVVSDPELAEGFVSIALPLPASPPESDSTEREAERSIVERLAFEMIATRLDNAALRGEAPYERAEVSSASIVRGLDAPELTFDVGGDAVGPTIRAATDEFERVVRFGFSDVELERAVAARRSSAQRTYDGRGSRQDVSYASEYVRHVLEGEWYVTADQEFAFVDAVLDRVTPESAAAVLADRSTSTGAHAFVAVPEREAEAVASEAELIELIVDGPNRDLDPPPSEPDVAATLIDRPAGVEEVSSDRLATNPFTDALDPLVLTFPNGVTVSLNTTTIVEREVFFEARSPGGLRAVGDDEVADAQALGPVIADSGAGPFDRVALAAFLDDKSVSLAPTVDTATDAMSGTAATDDLEVLFQLVHLLMTSPNADPAAVERYVDDRLPFAEDPSIDIGYAEFDALLTARYDEPRFLLPTPETLATVDADGIEAVAVERFGDAGDWSFAFSGDFDVAEATELARAYLGSLPASGNADPLDYTEPAPPPGVVQVDAVAGRGETANVSFLFTSSASSERRDDIVARVTREVIANRLTDVIREELGDSYSPFTTIDLGGGATPAVETYISVTTAPDLVDDVATAVLDQLTALRIDGPTDREFDNASTTVGEQLNFINNAQINDEVLNVLVDRDGNPSFDDFVNQGRLITEVGADDVQEAMDAWIATEEHIEVRVLPAS